MPDKEGLETIMELRRDYPEVKIIAMSGGGRLGPGGYLDMAKKLGAQRTVAKPFTREAVLEAVSQIIQVMGHALGH
jgi:CheY-like chemotaxis protein